MVKDDDVKNPRIVVNCLRGRFGGHHFLREVVAEDRKNGAWYVKCKPIINVEDVGAWEIMTGRYGTEAEHVFEELLEPGCRIEIPGGGKFVRPGAMYVEMDPQDFPEWFMASSMGQVQEVVQALRTSAMTIASLQRKKQMSDTQLKTYLASGGMNDYVMKRMVDPLLSLVQTVQTQTAAGGVARPTTMMSNKKKS